MKMKNRDSAQGRGKSSRARFFVFAQVSLRICVIYAAQCGSSALTSTFPLELVGVLYSIHHGRLLLGIHIVYLL